MSEHLTLTVEAKVLGQRKPLGGSWSISLPLSAEPDADGRWHLSLCALLTRIVGDEVAAFHERQAERRLARVLSRAEIEQGAAAGKVEMGGREPQAVRLDAAVAAALQAFEDRLYLVLLDGVPVDSLESELALGAESHLTFVRLVALVGG